MTVSAGILPYRRGPNGAEVFLIHMGGPYWKHKARSWSIPKGIVEEGESIEAAARREFAEETGEPIEGDLMDLGEGRSGSKRLRIFAAEAPQLSETIRSNTFRIEWPPHTLSIFFLSSVNGITEIFVIGTHGLGNGSRSSSYTKKMPRHFLSCSNFGKGSINILI